LKDLYCAYYELYSRGEAMKQALAAWQVAKQRYDEGALDVADLAQIEEQYQLFRAERLEPLGRGVRRAGGVLEAERRLRYVLGLPPEDGTRLVPQDVPVETSASPDWHSTVSEAFARRPELIQVQHEIEAAELRLRRAKDLLLPDLRAYARANVNGAGGTFGEGVRVLAANRINDYVLRLFLQVPIGVREGNAEVRRARLQLAQRFALLRDQQGRVVLALQRAHRDVVQFREEIRIRRSRREAAATQLKRRTERFEQGRETIDFLLQAQRNWSDALRDEYVAVCNYNVALADYERQKGTILEYRNVAIEEGPLPDGAQPKASEHIRRRLFPCPDWAQASVAGDHVTGPAGGRPGQVPQPAEPAPLPRLLQEQQRLPDKLETTPTSGNPKP
jgi:outer membrane protein TolC